MLLRISLLAQEMDRMPMDWICFVAEVVSFAETNKKEYHYNLNPKFLNNTFELTCEPLLLRLIKKDDLLTLEIKPRSVDNRDVNSIFLNVESAEEVKDFPSIYPRYKR